MDNLKNSILMPTAKDTQMDSHENSQQAPLISFRDNN